MRSMIGKGAIIFQHYDTDEERTKNKGTRMTANTETLVVEKDIKNDLTRQ